MDILTFRYLTILYIYCKFTSPLKVVYRTIVLSDK